MSTRLQPGQVFGRWTVLRFASPEWYGQQKRPRVIVRCVCGVEQHAFEVDLKRGRSAGCRSQRCLRRWEASCAAAEAVTADRVRLARQVMVLLADGVEGHHLLPATTRVVLEGLEPHLAALEGLGDTFTAERLREVIDEAKARTYPGGEP